MNNITEIGCKHHACCRLQTSCPSTVEIFVNCSGNTTTSEQGGVMVMLWNLNCYENTSSPGYGYFNVYVVLLSLYENVERVA
jgi:hypothetical protein